MHYHIFYPKKYSSNTNWPLLVYLHGATQRGDNIDLLKKYGPFKAVSKLNLPFVILAPQCEKEEYWETQKVVELIKKAMQENPIDSGKIYLTGYSMGGFGTWQIAGSNPELFAAIAPLCGGGTKQIAKTLQNMPVWIFHGILDNIIPVHKSDEMNQWLSELGNKPVYTRYPHKTHNIWHETYSNPELYQWFLKHNNPI